MVVNSYQELVLDGCQQMLFVVCVVGIDWLLVVVVDCVDVLVLLIVMLVSFGVMVVLVIIFVVLVLGVLILCVLCCLLVVQCVLEEIVDGDGDLICCFDIYGSIDELGCISVVFNCFVDKVEYVMFDICEVSYIIYVVMCDIVSGNMDLLQCIELQVSLLEQIVVVME